MLALSEPAYATGWRGAPPNTHEAAAAVLCALMPAGAEREAGDLGMACSTGNQYAVRAVRPRPIVEQVASYREDGHVIYTLLLIQA